MIPLMGSSHKDKTILSGQWWPGVEEGRITVKGEHKGDILGVMNPDSDGS